MSIDLKGNTNYVGLKNLGGDYIVPRTALSAIDMDVANGLEVNGDTIKVVEATPAQVLGAENEVSGAVITGSNFKKILAMGQATLLEAHTHTIQNTNANVEWSFNGNQLDVTGVATGASAGIYFLGPISGPATKNGKFLIACDVFVPATSTSTNFSITGPTFAAAGTYPTSTTNKGTWVRLAGVINTTTTLYSGNLNFVLTTQVGAAVSFSIANLRLLDVTDFSADDISYLAGAGQYNTIEDGQTVIKDGPSPYLYKPGYGIKIKGDTIEIDTSVLAVDADDFIYGVDMDTDWSNAATSCMIGGGIRRVVMDRSNGIISEVADFDYMPAHEAWRRCVMDDLSTKHVNYYLDKNDSNLKEDHTPAVLTGEDGDVMVEWPITYVRVDQYTSSDNHKHQRWLVSLTEFEGSRPHDCFYVSADGKTVGIQYVGAFRMGGYNIDNVAVGTDENSWTVIAYGTGAANAYYGRSVAGVKPIANTTLQNFRVLADNNGGHVINTAHAQFLALMMLIEYGTDIQRAFNNGFASSVALGWGQYRLCGRTASFGNNSTPTTAVHANSLYEGNTDDDAGFYRPTFATASAYANSTYVIRRHDRDVNVGKLAYNSTDYKRDKNQDVGYQIIVGGATYDRGTPFENESEGIMYYKWTNGTTNYYTTDHSPTTDSILYSDLFGDVSSATIEGDTDLYAWYNASATPTTIYTTVESPNVGNVTVVDYNDTTLGTGTKGLDAYAWAPDKQLATTLYTATAHPVKDDVIYSDSALTTTALTITSVAGTSDPKTAIIQCSYRGIEDPFGSQWEYEDGAWALMTITVGGKKYYRGVDWNGTSIAGGTYYSWYRDFEGADMVWTNTKECTIGTTVAYTYNGSSMSSAGTVTDASSTSSARSCDSIWMTTSTDAYAVMTAIKLGDVIYWRNSAADQSVSNTKYYGWKSEAGAFIYTTVKIASTSTTAYTISGTTVTSAGTVSAVYYAHQTYLHNYSLVHEGLPRSNNYVKTVDPHTFYPLTLQSSSAAWFCDYFYNNNAESSAAYANPRLVIRGGTLANGAYVGPFYLLLNIGFSYSYWCFGSRLAV